MLATLAVVFGQAPIAPQGVGWEHVVVRHEPYEDFHAGGRAWSPMAATLGDAPHGAPSMRAEEQTLERRRQRTV